MKTSIHNSSAWDRLEQGKSIGIAYRVRRPHAAAPASNEGKLPTYLTPFEFALHSGLPKADVNTYVNNGKLPCLRTPSGEDLIPVERGLEALRLMECATTAPTLRLQQDSAA